MIQLFNRMAHRARYAMLASLACCAGLVQAQTYLPDIVPDPAEITCEEAIPFCNSVGVYWPGDHDAFCMYYTFDLPVAADIELLIEGALIEKIQIYHVTDPDDPCGSLDLDTEVDLLQCFLLDQHLAAGTYYIRLSIRAGTHPGSDITVLKGLGCGDLECHGCLPDFSPLPGKSYVVNAWVKVDGAPLGTINYEGPDVKVEAPTGNVRGTFIPVIERPVIDGWQLIEGTFDMPLAPAEDFKVSLECNDCTAYFDDVRIFPMDGSMKCYVYDPENLRFVAELDERHFATRYEYDNEGKLVRVKKETERGVMTIQETHQHAAAATP